MKMFGITAMVRALILLHVKSVLQTLDSVVKYGTDVRRDMDWLVEIDRKTAVFGYMNEQSKKCYNPGATFGHSKDQHGSGPGSAPGSGSDCVEESQNLRSNQTSTTLPHEQRQAEKTMEGASKVLRDKKRDSVVKCRDDTGQEVDWYILHKYPNTHGSGLRYLYMDESTNGWKRSKKKINSTSGTLANTLKPLFDFYDRKTEGFGYLMYNDQLPGRNAPKSFGHSKGVVMLNKQTGIWLLHSTPKFPAYRSRNFWPNSGNNNAQTFLCVTYSYNQFKTIGLQLMYIHAYSFDFDIPTTFHNELQCVAQRSCYPRQEPWSRVRKLTSLRGRSFLSFAKYGRFKDDLYSGLIAQTLRQSLLVRSWGKTKSPLLSSNCSIPYHVYNVKTVKLPPQNLFSDTVDHSKWCVTSDCGWTCIADMNRHVSQMDRGGGAICTDDIKVWRAFDALITVHEPCVHPHSDTQRDL